MPRFLQLTSSVSGESLAAKAARDEIMEAVVGTAEAVPFQGAGPKLFHKLFLKALKQKTPAMSVMAKCQVPSADLTQCSLGLLDEAFKGAGIVDRQVGKDLAIQFYAAFFQPVDELAVTHPIHFGSCGDAHDPQGAVLALFLFAAGVCEFEAALDRFFGGAVQFGFCEEITAGAF
jgi:hypothetical protein